jgi:hypothetical protein
MKRVMIVGMVLAVCAVSSVGTAQIELVSYVRDVLSGLCGALDLAAEVPVDVGIGDVGFICSAADTVAQIEDVTRDVHEGLKALTREGATDLVRRGLNMISKYTDMPGVDTIVGEVNGLLAAIDTDGLTSLSDYANALVDAVDQATAIARDLANNPTTVVEQAAQTVFGQAGVFDQMRSEAIDTSGEITKDQLELQVNAEASRKVAEELADNTAVEHTVAKTLMPVAGTADRMILNSRIALSTRAAMQAFTEGYASSMKQDAVIGQAIVDGLKAISQQNVMTNIQMSAQAQYLLEEQKQKIEAQRQQLEYTVGETYNSEMQTLSTLSANVRTAATSINTAPLTIDLAALGW